MSPSTATPAPAETPVTLQAAPARRSGFPRWAVAVLLAAAAAGAAGFAAGRWLPGEKADAEKEKGHEAAPPSETGLVALPREKWAAAGVRCEPVGYGPLADRAWRTGVVQFDHARVAHLVSPVEGVVREAKVDHGDKVAAGEVLAVIDSKEVGQAKFELARARLALDATKTQADWTRTVLRNADDLWRELDAGKPLADVEKGFKDRPVGEWREKLVTAYSGVVQFKAHYEAATAEGGAVPRATLLKARSEYETAEAKYRAVFEEARHQIAQQARAAELKLKEAQAAADTARAHLLMIGLSPDEVDRLDPAAEGAAVSLYRLRAPFAATVTEKHTVRGERVTAQHQMFELADVTKLWVRADVFEPDLPLVYGLAEDSPVPFRAPVAGLPERTARLHFVGAALDPASRAVPLVAVADNADGRLRPGMFVEVGLPRGTTGPVLHVPAAAVQRHDDRTFVFVPNGAEGFRRADVALGRTVGDRVEITAGLSRGDEVAVEGTFVLKTALLKDQISAE